VNKAEAKRALESFLDGLPPEARRETKKAIREHIYLKSPTVWALEELELDLDPWQQQLVNTAPYAIKNRPRNFSRILALTHRQAGKSTGASVALAHQAKYGPPGSDSIVLAPTARQSSEVIRRTKQLLLKAGARLLTDNTHSLEVATSGLPSRVIGYPGSDPSAIRGASVSGILCADECAFFPNNDETLLTALPFLFRHKETSRLIACTTPSPTKSGWFYTQWTEGSDDDYLKISAHVKDCRHLSEADLERERRSMPESVYLREFCLQWGGDDVRLFSDRALAAFSEPVYPAMPSQDDDPDNIVVATRPLFPIKQEGMRF
jgi:hypothetical protein